MNIREKLKVVRDSQKALLAANFYNFETCQGIARAAAALNQPLILQLTPSSIEYMGLKTAFNIGRSVSEEAGIESWMHLDHCGSIELVKRCLDHGFDSVMIDASDKDFNENMRITKEVVSLASSYNVNVEAELGYVPKAGNEIELEKFTEPLDARKFVEQTGISSLAIAIGSKHGFYKGKPKLEIDRLKKIAEATDAFLVLHGGSGIPAGLLREAISCGITKVNVATETKDIFMRTLKDLIKNSDEIDLRKVFPRATEEVKKLIEQKLKIVGMI